MYTYRDVKSGEAYRGLLESLGWKKPRKKEATFTKTYPTGYCFRPVLRMRLLIITPVISLASQCFGLSHHNGGNSRENSNLTAQKDVCTTFM